MKKLSFEFVNIFAAVRTAGALIAGNGVVQWYVGASGTVVAELLVTGLLVIVVTSITFRN